MFPDHEKTLPDLIPDLVQALRGNDQQAFENTMRSIAIQVRQGPPPPHELTAALEALKPTLLEVPLGMGVELIRLATVLVEIGGDPLVILETSMIRVCDGLEAAAGFPAIWETEGGGEKLPASGDSEKIPFVLERMRSRESALVAEAWFSVGEWIPSLLVALQQEIGRKGMLVNEDVAVRLMDAAQATTELIEDAHWLYGLLLVLDDEKVIVLHRESGRGYELTIGGIGDNFQLHTLLAARLIGDPAQGLIEGTPPEPEWVAAASDGPDLQPEGHIYGQFNLVDWEGDWIWHEGRPLDIPELDGVRVIVLDPEPYRRSWNTGRVYPLMPPTVRLDRRLSEAEAAAWLAKVSPAKAFGESR